MKKQSVEELLSTIKERQEQWITFGITDMDGVFRAKTISTEKFEKSLKEGIGFCNVIFGWDINDACYDNNSLVGWHTGYPDVQATLDPESRRTMPWDGDRSLFIADLSSSGLSEICPRNLLFRVANKAEQMGFTAKASSEFEWYNFAETPVSLDQKSYSDPTPITPGMFGYSMLRAGQYAPYVRELLTQLYRFDIPLEGLHTETGDGVYEAAITYDEIRKSADRAALFKTAVKLIAHQHEIMPSFMAKWNPALPGCSQHIHLSLWKDNTNAFYSEGDELSVSMNHFIAGVLYCLPYIQPMYAPVTNSYKRYVEGSWAPTSASWGRENRTTAIRTIGGSASAARIENRVPGSDANPYLAMAATLASGLYGIEQKLELSEPVTGNAYDRKSLPPLHNSLEEATAAMKNSPIASTLFGEVFARHFVETREWEVRQQTDDPNWEFKRYFEVI